MTQAVHDLLADERRHYILDLLARQGKVKAQQLVQLFKVSEDTIRRDLNDMAEQGLLRRVHGGALPLSPTAPGANWSERVGADEQEKAVLVAAVLRELQGGERLLVDSGTTNALLARQLPRSLPFTVITTSPETALALADHTRCEVILAGGRLHRESASLCGPEALRLVESVQADLCLVGVCTVSAAAGLHCDHFDELAVKQAMMRNARRVWAMVGAAKVGGQGAWRVAGAGQLHRLYTTAPAEHPELALLAELGVQLSCVDLG
ncbi:DeoR/GlpR family DNA-binding transcription regulator [Eleftheria terrae]|uniref:DeoR/GlpR family DNA-binding transcription regulator n=1 Tax=Eleftheria terrae TaxID=1597781 RepID=UPI00263B53E8|nr:DeoR/GlpR family DNA-binding transcription regulator [Eleftheria terrae]WKB51988.1 DeoR/GlpR family DNA-binding transcription regulator [Eleftheria terrae]